MMRWIERLTQWLKRLVTQPLRELNRWQLAVRSALDLGRFGARQLQHDRATEMAAALAFRTLFGLLPVLVVTSILVKALDMQQHFLEPLDRLFEFWGMDQVRILLPSSATGETTTLANWLHDRVREAESVDVAAIGWVGVAITVYAAISLVVTVEECFNVIYRAPQGRPWTRRVPLYWFALTTSPVIVIFGSYINGRFEHSLAQIQVSGWLLVPIGWLWSVLVIWLLMFTIYVLFPNTIVRARPAMVGAVVAAILLEIGKRTLGLYLQNALSVGQLYGSLGLIPLFMFWVYLMWLAVLFGLQVSSTLQHLHGRQLAELEQRSRETAMNDPAVVVAIMRQIALQFQKGQTTKLDQVARDTGLAEPVVERLLAELVDAQLLHRVAESEHRVALNLPPSEIRVDQVLKVAFNVVDREIGDGSSSQLVEQLRRAQLDAMAGKTLHDILTPAEKL